MALKNLPKKEKKMCLAASSHSHNNIYNFLFVLEAKRSVLKEQSKNNTNNNEPHFNGFLQQLSFGG